MKPVFLLSCLAAGFACTGIAQEQPGYVQTYCVKVIPGKISEFEELLADITKLAKVRVESGRLASWSILRSVIPSGETARCDYALTSRYEGFPPEPPDRQQVQADFRKANIQGTYPDLLTKRDSTSKLVSNDLWRNVAQGEVGAQVEKGGYVRVNLYKTNPGHMTSEWTKLEIEGWRPFAEAMAKETPGLGWRVRTLFLPAGTSRQYDGMTTDILPDWAWVGKSPSLSLWDKVHPDQKAQDYLAKVDQAVSRYKVELYRAVEMITKSNSRQTEQ
ncbi:MAG: hypothetical protein ACJ74Y_00580 [Bryobacteraceae bacterium]